VNKIKLVLLLIPMLFALMAVPASAAALPDSTELVDAQLYTGLLETGDLLIAVRYNITYTTVPTENVDTTFVVWMEDVNTRLATGVPYPYFDSDGDGTSDGYGNGVASIYMTAAQTYAAGLTDVSGVWNNWPDTSLNVYVEGNPAAFSTTIPYDASSITASNSTSVVTASTNQAALGAKVLVWAAELQAVHAVTLIVSGQNLLNDTFGAGYFSLAIPGLRQMAPSIFAVSTVSPTIPTAATSTGDFASAAETRFDASTYYGQGFVTLASDMGLPKGSIQGALVLLISIALVGWGAKTWGTRGAMAALVLSAVFMFPIMWIGVGWIAWQAGAVSLAFIAIAAVLKTSKEFSAT